MSTENTREYDGLTTSAECRVCGKRILLIEAPLHVEDHKQRGEFPSPPVSSGVDQ